MYTALCVMWSRTPQAGVSCLIVVITHIVAPISRGEVRQVCSVAVV